MCYSVFCSRRGLVAMFRESVPAPGGDGCQVWRGGIPEGMIYIPRYVLLHVFKNAFGSQIWRGGIPEKRI